MIQAVVFDIGKVLLDFDYGIASRAIAARGREAAEKVAEFLLHTPLLYRYETGLVSRQEFFEAICHATGYCGTIEDFTAAFADIFEPITPMVELQSRLRARGYPTYIFSNTNEIAVLHMRQNFPFFANFDGYIFSYEQGSMKPDAGIYEALEKMAGKTGGDLLYLDDRPENVAAGVGRGWQGILHETPEKTIAAVTGLGLLNGSPPR